MDARRKQRVARATEELLQAVRELDKTRPFRCQRTLLVESPPQKFLRAISAFAEAIGS
jgi:hypothetical protein